MKMLDELKGKKAHCLIAGKMYESVEFIDFDDALDNPWVLIKSEDHTPTWVPLSSITRISPE